MQQSILRFLLIAGLFVLGLSDARAFSLGGPVGNGGDSWQVQAIGYGPPEVTVPIAPKNVREGYRHEIPVMYYTYSPEFVDYFGTNGITAVDQAFGLLNNELTNGVGQYTNLYAQVPLNTSQINYTAQAFQIQDLKSYMMAEMMLQLGLDYPEDNTWRLYDRWLPTGGKCPGDELYYVVQRNYAETPAAFAASPYSAYVNNVLYSYDIEEICSGFPVLADTVNYPVDEFADNAFTAVASGDEDLLYGVFYTGLTADDISGLAYLYNTNNVNWETVGGGSLLFDETTNKAQGEVLFPANTNSPTGWGTFNLGSLLSYASTNNPASVLATFPGVVISSSSYYYSLATNATVSAVIVPPPIGSPVGTLPTVGLVTNYSLYLATNWVYDFANIVTQYYHPNTTAILQTVKTGPLVGAPVGSPIVTTTNNSTVILSNVPSGSYYFVPLIGTNLCGAGIQFTGLTSVIYTTNLITTATTNLLTSTNLPSTTNATIYTYSQSLITCYTDYTYVAFPVSCGQDAGASGLYQGVGSLRFVRVDYDSLIGQTFDPFTNSFTKVAVTNSQPRTLHFDRLVTVPDILVDAQDIPEGPGNVIYEGYRSTPGWNTANVLAGLAGPGTIDPPATIGLNTVGNIYENGSLIQAYGSTNGFLGQLSQYQVLAWGSFDGSTNAPIVYPDGSSIENLEKQIQVQVTPAPGNLPSGTVNQAYSAIQFSISGGNFTPQYTWSTSGYSLTLGVPAGTGLPPGMTMSSSGLLSGTPTQAGTYDFTVTMTDSVSQSVQWYYTIIVN